MLHNSISEFYAAKCRFNQVFLALNLWLGNNTSSLKVVTKLLLYLIKLASHSHVQS